MYYLRYVLLSIVIFIIQFTVVDLIAIRGIKPDLLLLLLVFIALREKQYFGTLGGFFIGLIQDAVSGFWGISSLSRSVAGFLAGLFSLEASINKQKTYLISLSVAALMNDLIYFFIFVRGSDILFWEMVFYHAIPTTCFTMVFGIAVIFIFPKYFRTVS